MLHCDICVGTITTHNLSIVLGLINNKRSRSGTWPQLAAILYSLRTKKPSDGYNSVNLEGLNACVFKVLADSCANLPIIAPLPTTRNCPETGLPLRRRQPKSLGHATASDQLKTNLHSLGILFFSSFDWNYVSIRCELCPAGFMESLNSKCFVARSSNSASQPKSVHHEWYFKSQYNWN